MKGLFSLLLMTGLVFVAVERGEAFDQGEVIKIFVAAESAYKNNNYQEAIKNYEQIINGGWESGPIYFNLGNAYFKNGKLGQSILSYERAKRLIPRDSDLNYNYQYVASQTKHFSEAASGNIYQKFLMRITKQYTVDELLIVIVIGSIFFSLTGLFALYFRCPSRLMVSSLIFFALWVLSSSTILLIKQGNEKNLAVITKDANANFEPREDSTAHFKTSEGMIVRILKQEGAWVKIERSDQKLGWIRKETLERIDKNNQNS